MLEIAAEVKEAVDQKTLVIEFACPLFRWTYCAGLVPL